MKKFKAGDLVRCFGSEGQFLCYGVIKSDDYHKENEMPEPTDDYYYVTMCRKKPEKITEEHLSGPGNLCFKESELRLEKTTCNQLRNMPSVYTEWQQDILVPDCKHYDNGECHNPTRISECDGCPFDNHETPTKLSE